MVPFLNSDIFANYNTHICATKPQNKTVGLYRMDGSSIGEYEGQNKNLMSHFTSVYTQDCFQWLNIWLNAYMTLSKVVSELNLSWTDIIIIDFFFFLLKNMWYFKDFKTLSVCVSLLWYCDLVKQKGWSNRKRTVAPRTPPTGFEHFEGNCM